VKRFLRLVLGILIFVALGAGISNAAVKPGATCSKAGSTVVVGTTKYTCIKSGKKLAWNKGSKISVKVTPTPSATPTASPTPVPTVSATPTPTPTPTATFKSIRQIAQTEIEKRFIAQAGDMGEYDLRLDPNLSPKAIEVITQSTKDGMQFWGKKILNKIVIVGGTKSPWMSNEFCTTRFVGNLSVIDSCIKQENGYSYLQNNWPEPAANLQLYGATGGPMEGPDYLFRATPLYLFASGSESELSGSVYFTSPHELTHAAQQYFRKPAPTYSEVQLGWNEIFQANARTNSINELFSGPMAWIEGSAMYVGVALGEMRNPGTTSAYIPTKPNYLNTNVPPKISELIDPFKYPCNCSYGDILQRSYWAGGLTTELIIAKYGVDGYLDFMREIGVQGNTKDGTFASAFRKSFGISWDDFAVIADRYIADMFAGTPIDAGKY
jgi:hypothetical protein